MNIVETAGGGEGSETRDGQQEDEGRDDRTRLERAATHGNISQSSFLMPGGTSRLETREADA
jgi:hypothetical protein